MTAAATPDGPSKGALDLAARADASSVTLGLQAASLLEQEQHLDTPNLPGSKGPDVTRVFDQWAGSVVYVQAEGRGSTSSGSGVLVGSSDLAVTNLHVVGNATDVLVVYYGGAYGEHGESKRARVERVRGQSDLVLLRILDPDRSRAPVEIGEFGGVKVGQDVVAIGHPVGLTWSVTQGIVSQLRRNFQFGDPRSPQHADVIQTQAPLNPGNSGGPLFDMDGRVIGINTFVSNRADGDVAISGLNFAVSAGEITALLEGRGSREPGASPGEPPTARRPRARPESPELPERPDASGRVLARLDANGDGVDDTEVIDRDGDGRPDLWAYDIDQDGRVDALGLDGSGNGHPDTVVRDTNGDGVPDEYRVDRNEDGRIDAVGTDADGDGVVDRWRRPGKNA